MVWVSLKSKRVVTSRRAWSTALVSSAGSNSETTSKENSATRAQDGVDPGVYGGRSQNQTENRRHRERRSDADRALVQRLGGRPVVRVGAEVEVVDPLLAGPSHQLVEHRLAAGRQRLRGKVGDRIPEVVAGAAQLGHDKIQGLHRRRRRVLPAQVRDDAVEAHMGDSFRSRGRCAGPQLVLGPIWVWKRS